MQIGIPKETKDSEARVALTPAAVATLVSDGHDVHVQQGAGMGAGFSDAEYRTAGAIVSDAGQTWAQALVLKVKEPLPAEYPYLRHNLLFTYLHLAGVTPALTDALLQAGTSAIAYETVRDGKGRLPLLAPMSAIAGNMTITMGSYFLSHPHGGRGVQLGTVLGQRHGQVVILGDGIVGMHAAASAAGLGAQVQVFGIDTARLAALSTQYPSIQFSLSSPEAIARAVQTADLVVGAVLLPGARAPRIVTRDMVQHMQPGAVIVDVSIDQGGCIETSVATSHSQPVYSVHGVTHYCVTNMPGAYPRTATEALSQAILPYVRQLTRHGLQALTQDPGLQAGLNTHQGRITCQPVAEALGREQDFQPY